MSRDELKVTLVKVETEAEAAVKAGVKAFKRLALALKYLADVAADLDRRLAQLEERELSRRP